MQNGCKYNHDDASDSDAACLSIRVFKMDGTAEGGNGRTPSAASISLPSSVASNLHLESGTNVYASYTCNASVPRGFLAPVSIPRSAYFPQTEHACVHRYQTGGKRHVLRTGLSVHGLGVDGLICGGLIDTDQSHMQHDCKPGPSCDNQAARLALLHLLFVRQKSFGNDFPGPALWLGRHL